MAFFEDKESWKTLKAALDGFGRAAGLFDEISVKSLGGKGSEPFRMRVRKFGPRAEGPTRNPIDVGYGVGQVLPILRTHGCRERTGTPQSPTRAA